MLRAIFGNMVLLDLILKHLVIISSRHFNVPCNRRDLNKQIFFGDISTLSLAQRCVVFTACYIWSHCAIIHELQNNGLYLGRDFNTHVVFCEDISALSSGQCAV